MTTAAYLASVPADRANNPHILNWWTTEQDEVVKNAIASHQWHYFLVVPSLIDKITDRAIMDEWRASDPLCSQYDWTGVLSHFIAARGRTLGFEQAIQPSMQKSCLICSTQFQEADLLLWAFRRLGDRSALDYCEACCRRAFQPRSKAETPTEVEAYAVDLAAALQTIPPPQFFENVRDLHSYDPLLRTELMKIAQRSPTVGRIKKTHGSWFQVLVASGVLPEGTLREGRGTRCLATDGHVCLSIAEKTIDDWLTHHDIQHEKEPFYPNSRLRADFKVGDVLIEYFGLAGDSEYDKRIEKKRYLASIHGIELIEIYPVDLASWNIKQRGILALLTPTRP
ncbi:hypothetical protein ACIGKR_18855 [Rhodococcus qingshengii]|uniref:hypothetical protein n=1 Tax=Rhodococcus qingshengii TaxID=334542 RepID=UPI0037C6816D